MEGSVDRLHPFMSFANRVAIGDEDLFVGLKQQVSGVTKSECGQGIALVSISTGELDAVQEILRKRLKQSPVPVCVRGLQLST